MARTLTTPGFRAVPTLTYKELMPAYEDEAPNPDNVTTNAPGGGFTWDGRANTLAEQVAVPLLSSFEMANKKLRCRGVCGARSQLTSRCSSRRSARTSSTIRLRPSRTSASPLQQYQLEDPSFHPTPASYDYAVQVGLRATGSRCRCTAAELRGYSVYINPDGGNCFACHYNGPMVGGGGALFTDFTYAALGCPA